MTEFEKRVEAGALARINFDLVNSGRTRIKTEDARAIGSWGTICATVRAILAVTEPMHAEEMASRFEKFVVENGRQECCGVGAGMPPECCGSPEYWIDVTRGAASIREAGKDRT